MQEDIQDCCAFYFRTASINQNGSADFVKDQLEMLSHLCSTKCKVATIYSDEGYSGTNFNRPAFRKMMNEIQQKKIRTIVVTDMTRLARSIKALVDLVKFFHDNNVEVLSLR